MPLVLLTILLFIVFGIFSGIMACLPIYFAINWYRKKKRIDACLILLAGFMGIAFNAVLVFLVHRQMLPIGNVFLCWLHFLVPAEAPYRFFAAWAAIGFCWPALAAAVFSRRPATVAGQEPYGKSRIVNVRLYGNHNEDPDRG